MQKNTKLIDSVTNDGRGASYFGTHEIELNGSSNWMLSEQQQALNFRLRSSAGAYQSDWHVAGDPTLLIVLSGSIEIELRDGASKRYSQGDMFVAKDFLLDDAEFSQITGHRARVIGSEELNALHLKLDKRRCG